MKVGIVAIIYMLFLYILSQRLPPIKGETYRQRKKNAKIREYEL